MKKRGGRRLRVLFGGLAPESLPGFERLRVAAQPGLARRPVGRFESKRIGAKLCAVDQEMLAANEEPMAIAAFVGVVILDCVNDKAIAVAFPRSRLFSFFFSGAAVHRRGRRLPLVARGRT